MSRRSGVSGIVDREVISRVYSYVAYRIGSGPDAEDLTSEAVERAIRYQESFDPKRGNATSWLVGIAQRVLADYALNEHPATYSADVALESHETRSLRGIEISLAVAKLDRRDQEIIALRFGADLTAREIARLLGLRTNTVEVALHRALARLRADLVDVDPLDARTYPTATPDTP